MREVLAFAYRVEARLGILTGLRPGFGGLLRRGLLAFGLSLLLGRLLGRLLG